MVVGGVGGVEERREGGGRERGKGELSAPLTVPQRDCRTLFALTSTCAKNAPCVRGKSWSLSSPLRAETCLRSREATGRAHVYCALL